MSASESVKCFWQLSAFFLDSSAGSMAWVGRMRLPRHSARAVGLPDTACGAQLVTGVAASPQRGGDEAEAKILELVHWIGDAIVRQDRSAARWKCSSRSAAVWLEANASSSWHAASDLPATARSKQPDRVNPGYRFWQCHPQSGPKLHNVAGEVAHSGGSRESGSSRGQRAHCSTTGGSVQWREALEVT